MDDLWRALSLLTALPVRWPAKDAPLGRAMAWFPAVGLLLGLALALLAAALRHLNGSADAGLLVAALLLAAWAALTGALHLDGWADSCDGLLATVPRERRLEILRDPRVGSFGAVGLALLLLVKLAALRATSAAIPLLLAPTLARWAVVLAAWRLPSARPGGMGDRFREGLEPRHVLIATVGAAAVALAGGLSGALAVLVTVAVGALLARLALDRLGGMTGDIFGALVELVETAVLAALVLAGRG